MKITVEYYPISGYVVEIEAPHGTYQLSAYDDLEKAETTKEVLKDLFEQGGLFEKIDKDGF